MDWSLALEYILKGLGSAAATLVITLASILFAKLKTKISESRLNTFIEKTVKAAEQLFPNMGTKTGTEKYKYVVEQVIAKFPKLENNDYLKNLIEGAVYTLSQQEKKLLKAKTSSPTTTNKTTTTSNNTPNNGGSTLQSF